MQRSISFRSTLLIAAGFVAIVVGGCTPAATAVPACGQGLMTCNGTCVNTSSDGANCGRCGTICPAGQLCSNGACGSTCAVGTMICGSSCANINTDAAHCGNCATMCRTGQSCSNGACACPSGQVLCNNACAASCGGTGGSGVGTGGSGVGTGGSGVGTGGSGVGTGGSGVGTGGSGVGTGGSGVGTGGSGVGTGGSGVGTGGTAGGIGGGGNRGTCTVASVDVISDFEENQGLMIKQGTPQRTGWWYVYYPGSPAAIMGGMTQIPARSDGPVAVAVDAMATNAACNKALHSTGTGFGGTANNYAGFGAGFLPMPAPSQVKSPYDLTPYTGISFKIRSGAGTPPAVLFEMLTKDNQPATSGGTAATTTIDLYNTRGYMLNTPWISTGIGTAWQTVTIPFGMLMPRWLPAQGSGMVCPAAGAGVPKCQAPKFNPVNVLGIQFSMYTDPGFPRPAGSTLGTYDLWVDDVTLVKGDMGLPTLPGFPNDGAVGSCTKPTGAAGKYLVQAYNQWKQNFVVAAAGGFRVQRPENNNDTVSEGIAYGMIIAVYMNDKALFDGLWTYWKSMQQTADGPLMKWNSTGGVGTATDADEDAAFAMLQASKKWAGMGTYAADAQNLMHAVLAHDMSGSYIKGGSDYGPTTVTNPSYFAPAWYREFAKADTANAAAWNNLATGSYTLLAAIGSSSANGLYPAWCTGGTCNAPATNTGSAAPAEDVMYQYDAHRIPWRFGTDYCWNGTAAAKTYLTDKVVKFFANDAKAGLNGIGRIADKYTPANGNAASAVVNSASIIGTAAVGAMCDPQFKTFLDDGYQLVLDLLNRGTMGDPKDGTKSAYSYYNATVGMLTLLSMTGNLRPL